MSNKKGVFFSTDALIALSIILIVVILAFLPNIQPTKEEEIHQDILKTLSTLRMGQTTGLPANLSTNPNHTVLEQIGEFYITSQPLAEQLASEMLNDIDINQNVGLWYGNTLIWSNFQTLTDAQTSYDNAENIETARHIISGIQEGQSVTGFSARAFLTSSDLIQYAYFGGYVGDGNISIITTINGSATSANLEAAINNNFELFVNGLSEGNFAPSPDEFTPESYSIPVTNFQEGENLIEIKGNNLHIAGGFIKISYDSEVQYQQDTKYQFPGIEGVINIYDGFYIETQDSGPLENMEIKLNIDSTGFDAFLNIGNTTVFNQSTNGQENITITDSTLSSLLDYQDLVGQTIPIRLGIANASFISNISNYADVVSVTDLSGSMTDCGEPDIPYICNYDCIFRPDQSCEVASPSECTGDPCGGGCYFPYNHNLDCSASKLDLAKQSNSDFISAVLNLSGNRIGLVGYDTRATKNEYHAISTNNATLQSEVSSWTASGGTCICCGINAAISNLTDTSTNNVLSMVVMSDGQANYECTPHRSSSTQGPIDAINSACDAYQNYNITVHAIGFGFDADVDTLQAIAECGNGNYYDATNSTELSNAYSEIAEIILAYYVQQTVELVSNLQTRLFPESYIKFTYTPTVLPFGLVISSEKQFDSNTNGTFSLPENATILETVVTSYSGPRWTDNVKINLNDIYKISDYGNQYVILGDPYNINIPNALVSTQNNISLTTGVDPDNSTVGSASNKIIYTILKNVIAFSEISASANGCLWTIEFEDDSIINNQPMPSDYSGNNRCFYDTSHPNGQIQFEEDAYQIAVLNLLQQLDLNNNGKIDVILNAQDLQISTTELVGIPFTWITEAQVRLWEEQ